MLTFLQGKRTYITAVVIFVVAVLQALGVINWSQEQFVAVLGAFGAIAGIFLRAAVK